MDRTVRLAITALVSVAVTSSACSSPERAANPKVPAGATSSGGRHAVIETDKGSIEIEFFANEQPTAVVTIRP
jgi:hypothetical protein